MANQAEVPVVKTEIKQEFGTVWIEDANGVPRKVRVLQVTPTKALAAGGSGGSGVVRAVVTTSAAGGSRTGQPPAARPSGSAVVQVVRAGAGRSAQQSAAGSAAQQTGRVSTARLVQRATQPAREREAAGSSSGATAAAAAVATVRVESPAVAAAHSPVARLQMQDRQQAGLGTPGRPGTRSTVSHRTPTSGTGRRLLLPAGGSPATPVSRPTPGTSAGKRAGQSPHLSWSDSKRRRYERNAKGLRHFSMKVCQKVREKGVTTYNEVADELVAELCPASGPLVTGASPDQQYEQKNIRRRVYDALNVLMAMEIISKERKQIKWLGLPPMTAPAAQEPPPDCSQEEAECRQRIKEKTQQLKDLVLRQIAFKNLVERNRRLEEVHGSPEPSSSVQLPFIVVNTDKKTVIDCSMSHDKTEYLFNFNDAFEIHDDIAVLQRMGMALGLENGTSTEEDVERAKSMLPPSLASFVDQVAREGAAASSEAAEAAETVDGLLQEAADSSDLALADDPLQGLLDAAKLQ